MDVSTYEPVVWAEVPAEQCDTAFVKQCEDREEEVCADVTETRCQVSPDISLDIKVATSIHTSICAKFVEEQRILRDTDERICLRPTDVKSAELLFPLSP